MARIEIPAELRGTPEQQLKQIYAYLFRLSETLNVELDRTGTEDKGNSDTSPVPIKGIDYFDGKNGKDGEPGPQGEKGEKGDTGPQGPKGDDGTGVTILGSYATADDLAAAHPTGNVGDSYLVDGSLYVWSETDGSWQNVGNIKGPKGDTGSSGVSVVKILIKED